jgi:hypothetical protein
VAGPAGRVPLNALGPWSPAMVERSIEDLHRDLGIR